VVSEHVFFIYFELLKGRNWFSVQVICLKNCVETLSTLWWSSQFPNYQCCAQLAPCINTPD